MDKETKVKKVLFVVPYLDRAGVGIAVNNLINSLQKYNENIKIDVIDLCEESTNPSDYDLHDVNIFYVKRLRELGVRKFGKCVGDVIKKGGYDVVHIHTDLVAWIVGRQAKKYKVPIVVGHAHGQEFMHYPKFIIRLIEKPCRFFNRKYCDRWIGCSNESMRHMFGKDGILMPNYISQDRLCFLTKPEIDALKKENNVNKDKIVLGYAGRLNSIKNAIFIPKIYKHEEMEEYQSVFCGGYYEETQEKFAEYDIKDKAVFLGMRNDMDRLYNLFDIYVCPSLSEGMSMSLIQSQMMGVPCVVSKGVPHNNDLGLGLFVQCETYDTKEWKENIDKAKSLIGSKTQEEIKSIMKQNKLDEESIMEQLTSIYNI